MEDDIQQVLFTVEEIDAKVEEIAKQITRDYAGKELVVIGVLRGAVIFLADLVRAVKLPLIIDFIAVSSYGAASSSSGIVRILKDLSDDVQGKHLLIVEDIIDTGLTLSYLIDNLMSRQPASVKICTLIDKPERRKTQVMIDYNGFTVPDRFVVGYGLDYANKYRNIPYIGILKPEVYGH